MHEGDSAGALSASVLVLNRSYIAIHVVDVRRAITLLCSELAEVVDLEDEHYASYGFDAWREACEIRALDKRPHDDWLRSVHFEMLAPRVVRLLKYDRVPPRHLRFNRRNLFARDGHRCQYCGRNGSHSQLSIDHVLPRSRGGATTWENVVACCVRCNVKKGGRTPQEARMPLMTQPRQPRTSPMLAQQLRQPKYESWRTFLGASHAAFEVA